MIPQLLGIIWVSLGYRVKLCFRKFAKHLLPVISSQVTDPSNGPAKIPLVALRRTCSSQECSAMIFAMLSPGELRPHPSGVQAEQRPRESRSAPEQLFCSRICYFGSTLAATSEQQSLLLSNRKATSRQQKPLLFNRSHFRSTEGPSVQQKPLFSTEATSAQQKMLLFNRSHFCSTEATSISEPMVSQLSPPCLLKIHANVKMIMTSGGTGDQHAQRMGRKTQLSSRMA